MCYICKYKEFRYGKTQYNQIVRRFIQYVHQQNVPIKDLPHVRDIWINKECSSLRTSTKSYYRTAITTLLIHISKQEHVELVETVPVYHMTRNGEYFVEHQPE